MIPTGRLDPHHNLGVRRNCACAHVSTCAVEQSRSRPVRSLGWFRDIDVQSGADEFGFAGLVSAVLAGEFRKTVAEVVGVDREFGAFVELFAQGRYIDAEGSLLVPDVKHRVDICGFAERYLGQESNRVIVVTDLAVDGVRKGVDGDLEPVSPCSFPAWRRS